MVYCSACGVQNDDDSLFCSNCGTKLSGEQKQTQSYSAPQYQSPSYQQPPQKPQYVNQQTQGYNNNLYQSNQPQQSYGRQPVAYGNQPYAYPQGYIPLEDRVNPGLYILAFLFFPLGIVLFFANRQQKPRSARNLLVASILGIFLWI